MAAQVSLFHSKWHHLINALNYSTADFYQIVKEIIIKREIPDVKYSTVFSSEGGLFSSKREYLRVSLKEYVFDICAVPFGTGFFVSWWLGQTAGAMQEFTGRIPFIGPFMLKVSKTKTYHEMDTEHMFKESISGCILEAIDHILKAKGLPELTAFERRPQDIIQ